MAMMLWNKLKRFISHITCLEMKKIKKKTLWRFIPFDSSASLLMQQQKTAVKMARNDISNGQGWDVVIDIFTHQKREREGEKRLENLLRKLSFPLFGFSIGTSDFREKVINLNVCKQFFTSYGQRTKSRLLPFIILYFFMMMAKIHWAESSLVASCECSHSFISGSTVAWMSLSEL